MCTQWKKGRNLSRKRESMKILMETLKEKIFWNLKFSKQFNNKMEITEEGVSDFQDRLLEIIQTQEQREKKIEKKITRASGTHGTTAKDLTYMKLESTIGKTRDGTDTNSRSSENTNEDKENRNLGT